MTVWIQCDMHLTEPFEFNKPDTNVVIQGKLESTHNIAFKVSNLVVFSKLTSLADVSISTEKDCFNAGTISAKNVSIVAKENIYNGLDVRAVERIRALGIDVLITETGALQVGVPVHTQSLVNMDLVKACKEYNEGVRCQHEAEELHNKFFNTEDEEVQQEWWKFWK